MMIGLDAFSVRWQDWSAREVLQYASTWGLEGVQFSERVQLPPHSDRAALAEVRQFARDAGIRLEVGMRSIDHFSTTYDASLGAGEQQLLDMLNVAVILDAEVVRCFMGTQTDRFGPPGFSVHVDECVRVLRSVAPRAEDLGVHIALENHGGGDLRAPELKGLIERVDSSAVGVCFDSGNAAYAGEDPVQAAELLGPHVVTCQLRDARAWMTASGAAVQWVPLGQGDIDLRAITQILNRHNPQVGINLEVITGRAPKMLDYLDLTSEYWQLYPELSGQEFARFVSWLSGRESRPLSQLELPSEYTRPPKETLTAFRRQQLEHVEASLVWAVCNLG